MRVGDDEWKELIAEVESKHPEEMEAARLWAKEYLDKVKSGEIQFDIKPAYLENETVAPEHQE